MKKIATFLTLMSLLVSCTKTRNDSNNNNCPDFVKGDVIVGVKNTASIEEVFTIFNHLGLRIDEMSGFFYTSSYPQGSLAAIIDSLNTKSYIQTRGFSASAYVHYQTGIIYVTSLFFDMTLNNQKDWLFSKKYLKLTDTKGNTKNILVKVIPG